MIARTIGFSLLFSTLFACSGRSADVGPLTDSGANPDAGDASASDAAVIVGPKVTIRLASSTAPFPHADGLSGQTTRQTKQGVRRFRLLRSQNDPSPVVVFDHGSGFVEAGYDDGDDTVLGVGALANVPPATYTIAQMFVTHSRFTVASTMHYGGAYPGDFVCVQALSDGTTLEGSVRSRGWYRYIFTTNGQSFPQEGANAPLPTQAETGGFTMKTDGGETYYELLTNLVIPPGITTDVTVVVHVNMNEAFRWEDQPLPGYVNGVYDTTPVSFEPVRRYGANSFTLSLE